MIYWKLSSPHRFTICDLKAIKNTTLWKKLDRQDSNRNNISDVIFVTRNNASFSDGMDRTFSNDDLPTQLLVFDINGNYINTLETGYRIINLCYDDRNDRLVMHFDDMIQFGYLTLDDNLLN